MKRIFYLLFCTLLLQAGPLCAQQLVSGEYFMGPDPGVGNGTAFSLPPNSGDSLNMNITLSNLNLPPGQHVVRVRVKDSSGTWSTYIPVIFHVQGAGALIESAEYFWGQDPGVGNGTPLSLPANFQNSFDGNFSLPTTALPNGRNEVKVRVKSTNGAWSTYHMEPVIVFEGFTQQDLVSAEYFFGTDPGVGQATPLSLPANSEDSFSTSFPVPSTGLPKGRSEAKIRVKSSNGTWSTYHMNPIEIFESFAQRELVGIEYTYHHDSGFANPSFIALSNLDQVDSSLAFATTGLPLGQHDLLIRAVADNGTRSPIVRKKIVVCTTYGPKAGFELITNANYQVNFIDTTDGGDTYFWDFGDGKTDSAQSPVHDFPGPGVYNVCLVATNACGSDSTCNELVLRGIKDFSPKRANQGYASVVIDGFGLAANAAVRLANATDSLMADSVIFVASSKVIALFDLSQIPNGDYSLRVIQGQDVYTATQNFEVLPAIQEYEFELQRNGLATVAVSRNVRNWVVVKNRTNTDALAVPLILKYEFNRPHLSGFTHSAKLYSIVGDTLFSDYSNWLIANNAHTSMAQSHVKDSIGNMYGAYLIPYVPGGGNVAVPEGFVVDTAQVTINVLGTVSPSPWLMPENLTEQGNITNHNAMRSLEFKRAVEKLLGTTYNQSQWDGYFEPVYARNLRKIRRLSMHYVGAVNQEFVPLHAINGQILLNLLDTLGAMNQVSFAQVRDAIVDMLKINDRLNYYAHPNMPMPETGVMGGFRFCTGCATYDQHNSEVAMDPNEKETNGTGKQRHINGRNYLNYNIHFENVDTVVAHAGYVEIRDTLDVNLLDPSTLEILGFSVDTNYYPANPGYSEYDWLLDMRPLRPIYLRVRVRYIDSVNLLKWTFESLDTIWYDLPADPFAGFLPPNVNKPEGEGMVSFRIALRPGLPQGTVVRNQAEIVFDVNAPIITNEVKNLYDSIPPTSQFVNLPPTIYEEKPLLQFTGTDNMSGIMWYQLMVLDTTDGNTFFKPYLEDRSKDTATFVGEFGKMYWMYTLATDSALNVEDKDLPLDIDSVMFEDPCPLPFSVAHTATNPSCEGSETGMIELTVNNQFSPFEFVWSSGDSTSTVSSLAAGTYHVTIFNKYGCSDSISVTLTDPPPVQNDSISVSVCSGDSTYLAGIWVSLPGMYVDSLLTPNQCDSLVFYDVTIEAPIPNDSLSLSICAGDSINIAGQWVHQAGFYIDSLHSVGQCDSLVVFAVDVLPAVPSDSLNMSICDGDSILIGGKWVWQAGYFVDSLSSTQQCDSLVIYNVSIEPTPQKPAITQSSDTLFANVSAPSYQWFLNGINLPGQNQHFMQITTNGNYEVEAIDGNCNQRSDVFVVNNILLDEEGLPAILVYPNPVTKGSLLTVENQAGRTLPVQVMDLTGRCILEADVEHGKNFLSTQNLASGVYFITIVSPSPRKVFRFVVF